MRTPDTDLGSTFGYNTAQLLGVWILVQSAPYRATVMRLVEGPVQYVIPKHAAWDVLSEVSHERD